MAKDKVSLPITISLAGEVYEALIAGLAPGTSPEKALVSRCQWFLTMYANGGLMLQPSHLQRLREQTGKPLLEVEEIVAAVQSTAGQKDGQHVFQIEVDPAIIEPLEQMAKDQDWTIQDLLRDATATFMTNGWLYDFNPGQGPIYVKDSARLELDEIMGSKAYTGQNVLDKLKSYLPADILKKLRSYQPAEEGTGSKAA